MGYTVLKNMDKELHLTLFCGVWLFIHALLTAHKSSLDPGCNQQGGTLCELKFPALHQQFHKAHRVQLWCCYDTLWITGLSSRVASTGHA